jgi:hypothetical protein
MNLREEFEDWIIEAYDDSDLSRYGDEEPILFSEYKSYSIQLAWEAWQAATKKQESEL